MNRAVALRLSLLVSMGLVPLACSGERVESNDEDASGSGGSAGGSTNEPHEPTTPSHAGAAGSTSRQPSACTAPKLDDASGLVACAEGFSHRPKAVACIPIGEQPSPTPGGYAGASAEDNCYEDPSLCDALPHGFCAVNDIGAQTSYYCESGCVTDADCAANHICICGRAESPTGGRCVLSNCQTDADCGAGLLCASFEEGCGPGGFACLRDDDLCRSDADCERDECGISDGLFEPRPSRRACGLSVCGRPFLIEQQARVAPIRESNEWGLENLAPRVEHLSDAERAEQAAHFARLGQMEHASIAAFARFSLQLLALGAPPELVEACTRALADETRHARLCFHLASAYAGYGVAPGQLDVERSLTATQLFDVVDLVIAEGCVGETSAVLEALDAASSTSDPAVVAVYTQIAADEQRHAALAFRFLRWALERADREVRSRIAASLSTLPSTPAARDVVAPCLRALLEEVPRSTCC